MDDTRFDALTRSLATPAPRRVTLRLLAGGLLGALLPASARAAQRSDRDNDGLFDDDETNVYGTNPDVPDTDGDGPDDGQEVFDGTNPLVNENAPPPPADGGGAPPAATCTAVGGACSTNTCCQPDPNYTYAQCCFDANGAGVCTDVAALGTFLCPDPGVPATGCPVGQTNCGGFCTDLGIDHGNCGVCGNSCGLGSNCTSGTCLQQCSGGLTNCGNVCVDTQTHYYNCGACGAACYPINFNPGVCTGGGCLWVND